MLNLPKSTEINKFITKSFIHEQNKFSTLDKAIFDRDIKKITLTNQISTQSLSVADGNKIHAFFVMTVELKRKDFNEKSIRYLYKGIPQNIIFVLEFGEEIKVLIYHTYLIQTDWKLKNEIFIELQGIDLDEIWKNIILQIGEFEIQQGSTLEEQIEKETYKNQLKNKLEQLKKDGYKEKQPRKKLKIHNQICEIEKQLENYDG